jgi:hypothetical protein
MDCCVQGSIRFEIMKGVPAAFVALVIGLVATGIAWRQFKVAQAKLKLDLFERRYGRGVPDSFPLSFLMTKYLVAAVLALAATANAGPSTVFVNPPTAEYFRGPPGTGFIKICKEGDQDDTKNMRVPMGTFFADDGPIGEPTGQPNWWLLKIVTTKSTTFKPGQKCAVVPARVVFTSPPPAHRELKSVMRFEKGDNRHFSIAAPEDINDPNPDLAPWNPEYPTLEATANSDFK